MLTFDYLCDPQEAFPHLGLLTSPTSATDMPLAAHGDAFQMFFSPHLRQLKTRGDHHGTIMCLTMLDFLGQSSCLPLSASALSVP